MRTVLLIVLAGWVGLMGPAPANAAKNVCGDGTVTGAETCDDHNTTDFIPDDVQSAHDACPANCIVERCDPVPTNPRLVKVDLHTNGLNSIVVAVDYPEARVAIPGSGPAGSASTKLPTGVTGTSNDKDFALVQVLTKPPSATFPPGELFRIDFGACSGAPPVTAGDFRCVVLSASNVTGTDVFGATCSIALP